MRRQRADRSSAGAPADIVAPRETCNMT
jgi:hypothetical protein